MRQNCLICARSAPDGNLFCQDIRCQAELSPRILAYGEWLGDLEIVRPIVVLRSAVLYEARRQHESLLLKVAHPGTEHTQRLEREAFLLQEMQQKRTRNRYLPLLLPPNINVTIADRPYGRIALGDQLLYFCLFEHFGGEPLSDLLLKQPQPWLYHAGWIASALASALAALHHHRRLHLALTPRSALVRFDEKSNLPQVMLIDLGVLWDAADSTGFVDHWYPAVVPPAYTAPELIAPISGRPGYPADAYGVGLVLYEMLMGHPAFYARRQSDAEIYAAVQRGLNTPLSRAQDVEKATQVVERALNLRPSERPASAETLAQELIALFGPVPEPPRRLVPGMERAMLVALIILAVAFASALAATIIGLLDKVS
jgi:serine/threonine protein kinase